MSNNTGSVPDWRSRAVCRGLNDDPFFPTPGDTSGANYAKSICATCPVRRACLDDALQAEGGRAKDNRFGVRGGKTTSQRYSLYVTARKTRQAAEQAAA